MQLVIVVKGGQAAQRKKEGRLTGMARLTETCFAGS